MQNSFSLLTEVIAGNIVINSINIKKTYLRRRLRELFLTASLACTTASMISYIFLFESSLKRALEPAKKATNILKGYGDRALIPTNLFGLLKGYDNLDKVE